MSIPTTQSDRFAAGSTDHARPISAPAPTAFPGTEDVDPARVFATPGYTGPQPPSTAMAQTALWLAVPGLVLPIFLPLAVILAGVALLRARRTRHAGHHTALAALIVSLVGILLWGALYVLIASS